MTEQPTQGCDECERSFTSNRALTQHRRFVHDGATLFGYRLTKERGDAAASPAESSTEAGEPEKQRVEDEPAEEVEDSTLYWLVLAGATLAAASFLSRGKPAPAPTAERPSLSPCSSYGASFVPWAPR
jgi:hypothetical protein